MPRLTIVAGSVLVTALLVSCGGGGSSSSSAPGLSGTSWALEAVGAGGAQPGGMLAFDHGQLSGSTGCNSFGGNYTQSGSSLSITLGATTMIGCSPALEKQERAVLSALPKTATFSADGGKLTLLDSSGTQLLSYGPLTPASLIGPNWDVTGINNGKQAVASVIAGSIVTAQFSADGSVTGAAGCNMYHATYTLSGKDLHVGPPAGTRKLCSTPEGVMEQESAFLKALEASTVVELSAHGITLRDASGATQLTLAEPSPS